MQEFFLKIYGQVQGVFFRMETCDLARQLDLTGWVKNTDDGTVEILAQGDESNLKKLEEWTHQGPELARVERVEVDYREVSGGFENFDIRY